MEITHINQLDPLGTYTYADYLLWRLKEKIQLFKGKIFAMSPAPARFHQEISTNLNELLIPFFKGQKCKIYSAPFDVFFKSADGKESVVQIVQIYLYREGNYIALSPILETDEVQSVTYPDLRFPANKIFEE